MGYAVYEDRDSYIERWAGYGVPAECDWADCAEKIDRGLGYKCEEHHILEEWYDAEGNLLDEKERDYEGCGLYFCEKHLYKSEEHEDVKPKPDTKVWVLWMLVHPSWEQWREENPRKVAALRERRARGE